MDAETSREREKVAAELETRHRHTVGSASNALYGEEPTAIGIAILYLECDCLVLQGFQQSGERVGNPRIFREKESCAFDHSDGLDGITEGVVHRNIVWKDSQENFDRKYGNEKRIEIANKLFPPRAEDGN